MYVNNTNILLLIYMAVRDVFLNPNL